MHKFPHWVAASFFALGFNSYAGEFPDAWTLDKDAKARAVHAGVEGKPMPALNEKYKNKGLLIVGVCTSSRGQEKMEQTVKDKGIEYPTARDPQLKSEKAWAVHYYPTYAIVDRKGIVRIVGLQPNNVENVVKKLLDEPAAAAGSQAKS